MSWSGVAIGAVALCLGLGVGWELRGWSDGDIQTSSTATKNAQRAVNREVKSDREITSADSKSRQAITSAEASIANVKADPNCPPGVGRVSGPVADRLRLEFSQKE